MKNLADIAAQTLALALKAGADAASVTVVDSRALDVSLLDGKLDHIERSESLNVQLQAFAGQSQAMVSSGSTAISDLEELARRALAMARLAPPDRFAGLADPSEIATHFPDLDLDDATQIEAEQLMALAGEAETAARAVAGVTKTAGAGASASRYHFVRAMSNGFNGSGARTSFSFSVSVIAGEGDHMERDYDYASAAWWSDLEAASLIGTRAGMRAVKRQNPRKVKSQSVPVVYDPRVASSLISHLAGAVTGNAIARGTSFLKDALGTRLFRDDITIIDDPLMKRGAGSRGFDSDGLPVSRMELIANGTLTSWMLDLRSARQLSLKSTGHARGASAGPSNLYLTAGTLTPQELIADIKDGLYVTELLGHGANGVTGDYSRGAAGFWIENGQITYPVSEITIAGNLRPMYQSLTRANDLRLRGSINAPTCRVEGLTVAGA
ncbi:MAG: TldD/PmbA family protein [Aestuariivirgaceae bacterium]|nr:TldD/PmbA family protein [Aestuariivirgaceae bacterium]